jgi:hypothetical protein
LGDLGIDGRIILKWTFKKKSEDVNWIQLAQDRVQRRFYKIFDQLIEYQLLKKDSAL